jgi:hypothetical protein
MLLGIFFANIPDSNRHWTSFGATSLEGYFFCHRVCTVSALPPI